MTLAEEYARAPQVLPIGDAAAVQRDVTLAAFCEELARRADQQHAPTVEGVTLASLHSAKGLEWDAVFLVGLADGHAADDVREDARAAGGGAPAALRRGDPGPAVAVAVVRAVPVAGRAGATAVPVPAAAGPLGGAGAGRGAEQSETRRDGAARWCPAGSAGPPCWPVPTASWAAVRPARRTSTRSCSSACATWRPAVAAEQKVPAYVVFTDATLVALAERQPTRREELFAIAGIGPRKVGLYGEAVLASGGWRGPR